MIKAKILYISIPICLLILQSSSLCADGKFSLSGYYKNFSETISLPDYVNATTDKRKPYIGSVNNRLRFDMSYEPANWLSAKLSYSPTFQIQDTLLFSEDSNLIFFSSRDYRTSDIDSRLYPPEGDPVRSFGISQNLDRALITISPSFADIYIGRQAISWGSARMINPTDIITPFSFDALDTEERRGVDAVRMRIPTGMMGEIDLGFVSGRDFEFRKSLLFLGGRFYRFNTDISVLISDFQGNFLAGIDIARNIGGAGFWIESAYVLANYFQNNKEQGDNYFKATIGMDYSFTDRFYGFLEYHWNLAGAKKPKDYLGVLKTIAYSEGATYLMGRHYLIPGTTYQITPLIIFSGNCLVNLLDPSAFISGSLEYNIKQDIYLSIGVLTGFARKAKNGINLLAFSSEFGEYPDIFYSAFRIYF